MITAEFNALHAGKATSEREHQQALAQWPTAAESERPAPEAAPIARYGALWIEMIAAGGQLRQA